MPFHAIPCSLKYSECWIKTWLAGGLEHVCLFFPSYWECHHPNWLSYFSEGWLNHQPVRIHGAFDNMKIMGCLDDMRFLMELDVAGLRGWFQGFFNLPEDPQWPHQNLQNLQWFHDISRIQLFEKLKKKDLWAGFLAGWPKPQRSICEKLLMIQSGLRPSLPGNKNHEPETWAWLLLLDLQIQKVSHSVWTF